MSGISFSGIGSGLPVKEMIGAIMKAESVPLARMEHDKKFYESQISALGTLKTRLDTMKGAMDKLKGLSNFQHLSSDSTNESLFTATADHLAGATNANYVIDVIAEARNYQEVTAAVSSTDEFGSTSGPLTFTDKDNNPLLDSDGNAISIDTAGKTLDQIREEINKHEDLKDKVSASLVNVGDGNARLVLSAVDSGEAGRFAANFGGTELIKDAGLSSNGDSLDARIKINGIEATSSTNTFSDVITGVTIDLKTGAASQTEKTGGLQVKRDDAKIRDHIDEFVKAYNDVIIHINEAKKSSLYGDSTLRSIESEMRNVLYQPTESADGSDAGKNFLTMIGIEVFVDKSYDPDNPNSQNGTLKIDNDKFTKALDEDFDRVAHILGATSDGSDGVKGYAQRFSELANNLMRGGVNNGESYKGLLEIRTEGLGNQVKQVNERMDRFSMRLESMEARLLKQFNAADAMSAHFQSTSAFLMQQMAGLPGYGQPK